MAATKTVTTLLEDFAKLGVHGDKIRGSIDKLSGKETQVLVESEVAVVSDKNLAVGSTAKSEDLYEGKTATRELIERINKLPIHEMTEEDCDNLLEELGEKEIPDEDKELILMTKYAVRRLAEGKRWARIVAGVRHIVKKMTAAARRIKNTYNRKHKSHIRLVTRKSKRKTGARMAARKTLRKNISLGKVPNPINQSREEMVDRIDHIFESMADIFDDENVTNVFAKAMKKVNEAYEDENMTDEKFEEAVKPALAIIKRALQEIEDKGLGKE